MATSTKGTQGQTLAFDTETTLGTALASPVDLRYDSLTFPTITKQVIEDMPRGHENWANRYDPPIQYEAVQEGAIAVTMKARVGTTNYDPLTLAATTGGFGATTAANTTCSLDTSGNLTTVSVAGTPGRAFLVELDSGLYYPVLCTTTETGA